ncbi:aldo/keto reductase [Mycobacterium avium]|uniref:aldo/keto reductase n=1 Tax=Mycobacterium avium TaxID=1764 RepID=UPI001CC35C66|nr:aldo/keto reductase [Mycobacterium avium]
MTLDSYHPLGRSGLRVSRLALGAMTFAQDGWGCDPRIAGQILDGYLAAGGNFVDTADIYAGGASEETLGALIAQRKIRDRLVLSTKFTMAVQPYDPNSAGNGRKSMLRALEGSLRRLRTDYVDLYTLHVWDMLTGAEEVMRGLDDLVSAGKVRYIAFSDVPAWYAARAQTLADWRGYEPLCALQLEYSLAERGLEYEFPSLCQELGMGLVTWGPLGNGLLSGKYTAHTHPEHLPQGRITATADRTPPDLDKRTVRNWQIVAELRTIANQLGRSPAQIAVNWVANRPAVNSVILGATTLPQLEDTVASLNFLLPEEFRVRLDEVSAMPRTVPYDFMPWLQQRINAGISRTPPGFFADAAH